MEKRTEDKSPTLLNKTHCNTARNTPSEGTDNSGADTRSVTEDDLSLRFPRPSGSRHLANWVINSDPDIMRVSSVPGPDDGSGLSESTYELIHGVYDSNSEWSQDGNIDDNDNDTMGESTSSLENHDADDVHSATGASELEVQGLQEGSGMTERPSVRTPEPMLDTAATDSEDDPAPSTPSLDFAHQTLDTPSFVTEEPERPDATHTKKQAALDLLNKYQGHIPRTTDLVEHRAFMMGLMVCALALLGVILTLCSPFVFEEGRNLPSLLTLPSTSAGEHSLVGSTVSDKPGSLSTISARTPDSQVQDESNSYDWIFGPPRPKLRYTFHGNKFTAHVPEDVKVGWQEQDCVTVGAFRDGRPIAITSGAYQDGIFATIPAAEKYGDVEFVLEATCKPITRRAVHIRFPTFAESFEALADSVKNYRSLPEVTKALVPVLEHVTNPYNVGRYCGERARDTAKSAGRTMREVSDLASHFVDKAIRIFDHTNHIHIASRQATKHITGRLGQIQTRLQLGLLDAQIAAKLSWLGITGKRDAQDEYRRKAEVFMAHKRTKARQLAQRSAGSLD